jgi:hypothetical protein
VRFAWALLILVCLVWGCGGPAWAPGYRPPQPLTREVWVKVWPPSAPRALADVLTANRYRVHHVNLRLYRSATGDTWENTPVAVRTGISESHLQQPITLGALKYGFTYRLALEAYSDAEETFASLISNSEASQVTFSLPFPRLTGDVLSAERAMVFSAVLVLLDTLYDGRALFSVVLNQPQVTHVRVALVSPAGVVSSQLYTRGNLPAAGVLYQLKMATSYTLQATGLRGSGNSVVTLSTASASFSTPALLPDGTIETGPFGPFVLRLD